MQDTGQSRRARGQNGWRFRNVASVAATAGGSSISIACVTPEMTTASICGIHSRKGVSEPPYPLFAGNVDDRLRNLGACGSVETPVDHPLHFGLEHGVDVAHDLIGAAGHTRGERAPVRPIGDSRKPIHRGEPVAGPVLCLHLEEGRGRRGGIEYRRLHHNKRMHDFGRVERQL